MIRFGNFKLRTKLMVSFSILICLIIILTVINIDHSKKTTDLILNNQDLTMEFNLVQGILNEVNYLDMDIDDLILVHFAENERIVFTHLSNLANYQMELNNSLSGEYKELIMEIDAISYYINKYVQLSNENSSANLNSPISDIFKSIDSTRNACEELFVKLNSDMDSNVNESIILAKDLSKKYMFMSLLLVVISILFANYIASYISRPITKLTAATNSISDGNSYSPLTVNGNDELGQLTNSFNKMLKKINISKKKLGDYNKKLETTVKSRTDQLLKKEKQLIKANMRLKEVDKQKDEFISLAAHELKTPLTSIKAYSQILNNDALFSKHKAQRKKILGSIIRNSDKLYTLVLDIVDSSRISLGKLKTNIQTVDSSIIVNEVKSSLNILTKDSVLTTSIKLPKRLPFVSCDRERISQVFNNLITNAIKFTESGSITLSGKKIGSFMEFSITDTGPGIPKENQKMIFSRFYQVDGSFTRKYGGSGLGLSVCKGLVENMGGKIYFTTVPGKGSTFSFTLPIVKKNKVGKNG